MTPSDSVFGRYTLVRKLASGGMAELFLAKVRGEAGFERICVVKRILPHLAKDPDFVKLFLDEARLAARISHPNIVNIFDLGREGESYFLAMEYLAGEDGAQVLGQLSHHQQRMPVEVAVRICAAAAEALHYAHELRDESGRPLKVVHRDVSPSNLFVTYQGAVKLLDFGVARAENRRVHTQEGNLKGKVSYMAPEQVELKRVDHRADIWALGVCLHEFLTGQHLFEGESTGETIAAILRSEISKPSSIRDDVSPQLDAIVAQALAREPAERFATAAELASELHTYLGARSYAGLARSLGRFLVELFGEERAKERIELGSGSVQIDLPPSPQLTADLEVDYEEVPDSPNPPSEGRPWLRGVALGCLLAGLVTWWGWPLRKAPISVRATPSPKLSVSPSPPPAVEPVPLPVPVHISEPEAESQTTATPQPEPTPTPAQVANRPPKAAAANASRPKRADAKLNLSTNFPVTVRLGTRTLGRTPLKGAKVPPGEHRFILWNEEENFSRELRLKLAPGETRSEQINFGKGRLNVSVTPWAEVWLGNVHLGQTPLAGREVWEGRHVLRLLGPNSEKTMAVQIEPGRTVVVQTTLP